MQKKTSINKKYNKDFFCMGTYVLMSSLSLLNQNCIPVALNKIMDALFVDLKVV